MSGAMHVIRTRDAEAILGRTLALDERAVVPHADRLRGRSPCGERLDPRSGVVSVRVLRKMTAEIAPHVCWPCVLALIEPGDGA